RTSGTNVEACTWLRNGISMLASKGNVQDVRKKAMALHLLHQSEDPATMILLSKTAAGVVVGSGSDEMRYRFRDMKSHQVIRSRDIIFVDSIYRVGSATYSSSLTKPIQKSQVVLVDIQKNFVENDSIVAEYGLSLEITQSLGGSSYTSEWSKNSRSFKDSGRSYEEYSKDGASCKEGGSETPHNKAINEEMLSLEKNQACSLVRISAGKKASQRLWMFKVKEEQNGRKRYKAKFLVKGFQQIQRVDYNEIFSPVVKMTTIRVLIFVEDSWNEEPYRDVPQVGDEREVKVLRSFNWPPSELITEDGVLPESGHSQFNDVSSGYLVSKVS
nr:hypothetical protein [Tanacetum cinerariifolium]